MEIIRALDRRGAEQWCGCTTAFVRPAVANTRVVYLGENLGAFAMDGLGHRRIRRQRFLLVGRGDASSPAPRHSGGSLDDEPATTRCARCVIRGKDVRRVVTDVVRHTVWREVEAVLDLDWT